MNYQTQTFIDDLDRVAKTRQKVASYISSIADTLNQSESEGEKSSGRLGLETKIKDLDVAVKNLSDGVFRLLVLGDMKRGKSTFLNALIGENLLPSDVNPCTAVLTILRFGQEKKVIVYFNDKTCEHLDFKTFKRNYTIDPAEAKQLEEDGKQAFPNVQYAVVEYPLSLLEKGVEIIDSPGLNDTEARNDLTLGYINNCHAVLFVLSATQACTLAERRYLENYIKGRGLSVFFLINRWDQIRDQLLNSDDPEELDEAEYKLRRVFKANLHEHCKVDDCNNLYDERVFEVSSLKALRQRLQQPEGSLDGTGFPEFMTALNTFLTKERAISELRQARTLVKQTYRSVHETIERRVPLLGQDLEELRSKIQSVTPEFEQLKDIREQFKEEIIISRDDTADLIANSFYLYISNLGETFEKDFLRYQPELKFMDFLRKNKRQEFELALKQAFEMYLNDKISTWSRDAEKDMDATFSRLALSASQYSQSYSKITDKINEKLTGQKVDPSITAEDNSPGWAKWAMGLYALTTGDVAGVVMAGTGAFNWKSILINVGAIVGLNAGIYVATGVFLGPIGVALAGTFVGTLQANQMRKKVVETMKKELVKHLPQVAREQSDSVEKAVKECFTTYGREVIKRMDDDIQSRKAELDELLKQKESGEINREAEITRLKLLDNNIFSQLHNVEDSYDLLLGQTA